MTDRKTASELCMTLLQLAAVEEERDAVMSLKTDLVARQELDAVVAERDAATERAEAAEQARRSWEASSMRDYERANYHARLAADALRIGLEECERLRRRLEDEANHRRYLYGELLDCTRVLGIDFDGDTVEQCRDLAKRLGDREKVGEWWEVWCETGVVDVYRQRASAQRWARVDGDRLVHVTRWRKKR